MARDFTNPGSDPKRRYDGFGTVRRQTTAGKAANARRIGRAPLFAFVAGLALLLGAMPQDARAKACQSLKVGLRAGCVTPGDIKQAPGVFGEGDLTARDRMDEAGGTFDASPDVTPVKELIKSFSSGPTTVFATVETEIPAGGLVMIMASASLTSTENAYGAVLCDVILTVGTSTQKPIRKRITGFIGTVEGRIDLFSDSMASLHVEPLDKKTGLKVELLCGIPEILAQNVISSATREIRLNAPSLIVQYFPTRY